MRLLRILETGSIRSRLTGALLILGIIPVLVLTSSLVLIGRMSGDARRIELAASLRMGAFAIAASLQSQLMDPQALDAPRVEAELERMHAALDALEVGSRTLRFSRVGDAEGRQRVAATRRALRDYGASAAAVLAEAGAGPVSPARQAVMSHELFRGAESLRNTTQLLVAHLEAGSAAAIRRLMALQAAAAALALVVLLLTLWAVNRYILQAVPPLVAGLADVGAGRYGDHIEVRGENELSRVAQVFNLMSSDLERTHHALVGQQAEILEKNAALERADRLKSQFVANMSHELRTPLHAIIGYTKLLRGGVYGELLPGMVEPLRGIDETSQALLRLINDVLDVARIEAGRMDLHVEPFDLQALVEEVWEMLRPLALARGLDLHLRANVNLPKVTTDRDKVRRILLNLAGNALKFTRHGSVEIDLLPVEGGAGGAVSGFDIAVRDTGIGIPAEQLEAIFEDFHQIDGSATREHSGAGLGLAISRRLARHLGGDIRVESQVGRGSTFTLQLPGFVHVDAGVPSLPASTSRTTAAGSATVR